VQWDLQTKPDPGIASAERDVDPNQARQPIWLRPKSLPLELILGIANDPVIRK